MKNKTYGIHLAPITTTYIEVQASSQEEAEKKAKERFNTSEYYISHVEYLD